MPQCVVVCKQECNLSADIIVSPSTETWGCVTTDVAPQRCMTRKFPMFFYACGIENPTDFPFSDRGLSVGLLRFEMSAHKPFPICGYSFQNEMGFQRRRRCLGGRNPMEGRAFLAGRIQRNRGFVAHDLARKV